MKNTLVALSVGVIMSQGASAQKAPNFSGTWVRDVSRSDAAIQTSPVGAAKVVIRQGPEEIQIDTTTTRDGFSTEKYKLVAGKPTEAAPSRSTPTLKWEGTKLVTVLEMEINGFAVTVTEARSLNPTEAPVHCDVPRPVITVGVGHVANDIGLRHWSCTLVCAMTCPEGSLTSAEVKAGPTEVKGRPPAELAW
jgi:hypothetical protein